MRSSNQNTSARRTRDPDSKSAALQAAALQLFTMEGYENVSIAQIAKQAGIAVGTVYRFYPNKLALLRAMLEEIEGLFVDRMREDWASGGSHAERLDRLCAGLFVVAQERRTLLRLLTMTTDVVYEDGALPGDRIQEQIKGFFAEGMADGSFEEGDPNMMAAMAQGLVEGAIMQAMRSGDVDVDDAARLLASVMKKAFLVH